MYRQLGLPFRIPIEPMYKLLPDESRAKVKREYLLRRAVVMVVALIVVEVVATVGLLPSYVLSKARRSEVEEVLRLTALEKAQAPAEDLSSWLSKLDLKLKTLSPKSDLDRPSEAILSILEEKGIGVRLNRFSWARIEGQAKFSVSGIANDRQSLLALEARLNTSDIFANVTLPVSNLAKDKEIPFELKLTMKLK